MSRRGPGLASVVVDLGFGDSGKGLVTDHLVRTSGASVVVRYNGGAQAGHNVVAPDGRHHTFAQVGAGSFVDGVRTILAAPVVVHPTALLVEARRLEGIGVAGILDRIAMSEACRIVTPYHQALGRLRELARGDRRHGSCGVGIGETVADALAHPAGAVRAGDLSNRSVLAAKLARIRDRARAATASLDEIPGSCPEAETEHAILDDPEVVARWIDDLGPLVDAGVVRDDDTIARWVDEASSLVLEGAQGILLDETHGFHPHTTWSDCTTGPALAFLARFAPSAEVHRLGVLRTHLTRHGAGPLPTETRALDDLVVEDNLENRWQGPVRRGFFDTVLARHAFAATGGVDAIALTHTDLLDRLDGFRFAIAHRIPGAGGEAETISDLTQWLAGPDADDPDDLAARTALTERLFRAEPVYVEGPATVAEVVEIVEAALGVPVTLLAHGPSSTDVEAADVPRAPRSLEAPGSGILPR